MMTPGWRRVGSAHRSPLARKAPDAQPRNLRPPHRPCRLLGHREGLLTHPGAPVRAGHEPDGRLSRGSPAHVQDSPNFANRRFEGEEPSLRPRVRAQTHALVAAIRVGDRGKPAGRVPVVPAEPPQQPGELAVTWYGHRPACSRSTAPASSSTRSSASASPRSGTSAPGACTRSRGPSRTSPASTPCLISHDHYDHLDQPSIVRLEETHQPHYVVPLGVNAHLLAWGVPEQRITVLDWRDETEVAGIRLTCTEARHNSGRGLVDSQTLWAGWALRVPATAPTSRATPERRSASPPSGRTSAPST